MVVYGSYVTAKVSPIDVDIVILPNLEYRHGRIELREELLEWQIRVPVELVVYADIDMLKIVLRNLISNAIKFTEYGGTIKISAKQSESEILITVRDNGIGINPDDLEKLFHISKMKSSMGTAMETGTGLGLLLCKEFVEKHHGKIWVESEFGNGSEFKFTMPVFSDPANQIPQD
jgi:signal transduction histidine kinase